MMCRCCKQDLSPDSFFRKALNPEGIDYFCKSCKKFRKENGVWPDGIKDRRGNPLSEKKCAGCNQTLPIEDFTIKSKAGSFDGRGRRKRDVRHSLCRTCHNAKQVSWRKEHAYSVRKALLDIKNKVRAIQYLSPGMSCSRCGIVGHSAIFDFHHRDPELKEAGLSELLKARTHHSVEEWTRIQRELDKCDLVCRNCHILIHSVVLDDGSPNPDFLRSFRP